MKLNLNFKEPNEAKILNDVPEERSLLKPIKFEFSNDQDERQKERKRLSEIFMKLMNDGEEKRKSDVAVNQINKKSAKD